MKKLTLSVLVLSSLLGTSAQANNTLTFNGEVTDQTCDVNIGGVYGDTSLLLPTVPTSNLNVAGATAGTTNFTLSITGCTAPIADTPVNTLFIGNNVQPGGILGSSGSATNVGLQLLNGTQSIDLTAPSLQSGLVIGAAATSASHDFSVRYYATGAATAGTVVGSVQYEVAYD